MGRYDGEEYEVVPACAPSQHNFAPNGNCWKCNRSKDALVREAERILEQFAPDKLKKSK